MSRKQKRKPSQDGRRVSPLPSQVPQPPNLSEWLYEKPRYLTLIGIALIVLCTVVIYGQTFRLPTIDYEDSFYLVHSPYVRVSAAFSRMDAVWNEPYFANFHPVTTTTWLIDRALADKNQAFDALPFRASQLLYSVIAASLLIPLYRLLGVPTILAMLGALVYAVHPIHTEVVAWLSARKDLISIIFILLSFLAWCWARAAITPVQWRIRHVVVIALTLLAVLSKPIAVVIPALFVAYEFCSETHISIFSWRWHERERQPVLTRTLVLAVMFVVAGGISVPVFRILLARSPMHGGWLIVVSVFLSVLLLAIAPSASELGTFRKGGAALRVLVPPFVGISLVFGAGSAWTFWAQQQVGAIKGGLPLLPTLNLALEALLAYVGKAFVPFGMSASYTWGEYPLISMKGVMGGAVVCGALWMAMRFAGSIDRNRRLIAFGIFWFLIALVPVSNLVPTSTKMADRYLFVPTVGSILVLLAVSASFFAASRRSQKAVCCVLFVIMAGYAVWSYGRTEVWCGKTTMWNGRPQPDLSLWAAAVETNPQDIFALRNLGLAYLRLVPPDAEKALESLNRALQLGENNQAKIAGDKQLILSPIYESLGDGYLTRASQLVTDRVGSDIWQRRRESFGNAVKFLRAASKNPSGFASADARVLSSLAEACEGQAQMEAQELETTPIRGRETIVSERDQFRAESEDVMRRAKATLVAGNVSPIDPNYRSVILGQGNIIFGREIGATNDEKAGYYQEALHRYEDAAAMLPDDPRPFLYEGMCYERLTGIPTSQEDKQHNFALGEAALRKALTLNVDASDYSLTMPYQELAALYAHMNDYQSVLLALRKVKELEPSTSESANVEREIRGVEQYLATQGASH